MGMVLYHFKIFFLIYVRVWVLCLHDCLSGVPSEIRRVRFPGTDWSYGWLSHRVDAQYQVWVLWKNSSHLDLQPFI